VRADPKHQLSFSIVTRASWVAAGCLASIATVAAVIQVAPATVDTVDVQLLAINDFHGGLEPAAGTVLKTLDTRRREETTVATNVVDAAELAWSEDGRALALRARSATVANPRDFRVDIRTEPALATAQPDTPAPVRWQPPVPQRDYVVEIGRLFDGVRGTYDQLYPTNFDKYGIVDQIGFRNMHNARVGVTQKPHAKVTVDVDYNSYWLAHRRDGLYNAAGALVARMPGGAPGSHVAQEANVLVSYAVRNGLTLGAGYGRWFPGVFWKAATPGAPQGFTYTQLSYRF
jgi:hypothetical protein